jgi:hypothetical protein
MFLHTNFDPKWSFQVPGDFQRYHRRWQVVRPSGQTFADYAAGLGARDIEHEAYRLVVMLRCAPFLDAYTRALNKGKAAEDVDLVGFHKIVEGIDFNVAYRYDAHMLSSLLPSSPVRQPATWCRRSLLGRHQ